MNKYNNTYHSTIKMKLVNVKSSAYIDVNKGNYHEDLKFKVGDHVRISKYKNIFVKSLVLNWSEDVFVIKLLKILFRGHILLVFLRMKKMLERFTKKNCKKQVKRSLEL